MTSDIFGFRLESTPANCEATAAAGALAQLAAAPEGEKESIRVSRIKAESGSKSTQSYAGKVVLSQRAELFWEEFGCFHGFFWCFPEFLAFFG